MKLCEPDVFSDHERAYALQVSIEKLKDEIVTLYSELDELLEILWFVQKS